MRRFWAVLAAIAFSAPAMLGNMWPTPGPGFVVAAGSPSPAYRTVVTIGDTQAQTGDGFSAAASGRYADLQAQITWIIANKAAENIDFVLWVGDLINAGTPLPLSGCDTWTGTPDPSAATCAAETVQGACEAVDGCGWTTTATPSCAQCSLVLDAASEWGRVETEVARLHAAGIPVFTTQGNHDNLGLEFANDPQREPLGYDVDRFDTAFWDALDVGTFTDRSYEHIAENDLGTNGIGHAWTTAIDATPVLVVAIPYISGSGIPAAHQTWVGTMCAQHPTKPVLLVAHHLGEIRTTITNASSTFCPNLVLTAGGHIGTASGGNDKSFNVDGSNSVLETETDWTNSSRADTNAVVQEDYVTVTRFWMSESPHEVESFDYSIAGDANDSAAGNTIARQDFDLTSPTPYDLSPIETELAIAFDNATPSSARPAWPIPPTITSTCAATNDATLASCLSAGGRHVTVAAGTYTGSYTIGQDDIWLDMDNAAKITGGFGIAGTVNRFKMTGGEVEGGFAVNFVAGASDILFKNVNFDLAYVGTVGGTMTICFGTGTIDRMAFVDTTIFASRWTLLSSNDCVQNDLIIANVDAWSNYQPGDPGNDEGVIRFMHTNRTLVVDSHLRISPSGKAVVRQHYGNNHTLYVNNTIDSAATVWGGFWIDTDAGLGEQDDINTTFIIGNGLYQSFDGTFRDVAIDDSLPGNGIDVTFVYIHDNTAHHLSDTTFGWSTPAATTVDASGNTKLADFTAFPAFTGGADH